MFSFKKAGRIERVYFEITEANITQWEKPQIKARKGYDFVVNNQYHCLIIVIVDRKSEE